MLSKKEMDERIQNMYINNTLLVRRLSGKMIPLNQEMRLKDKEGISVIIEMPKETEQSYIQISKEDIRIIDAIYTFSKYNIWEISIEQLAGLIQGDFYRRMSPKKLKDLYERIEELQKIQIEIDAKAQFNKYKRLKNCHAKFIGKILDIDKNTLNTKNGKPTTVYRINAVPILGQYAEILHHIICLKRKAFMCVEGTLSQERFDLFYELLQKICIHTNPRSGLCKNKIPITLLGWDKNKKVMNGIIGRRFQKLNKRKADIMLQFIYKTLETLYIRGLIPNYQVFETPYIYSNQYYKKVQIIL